VDDGGGDAAQARHHVDGVMFGMVTDNMLYLRVDDHNRAAFKEAKLC
jgi:hypothetical protein